LIHSKVFHLTVDVTSMEMLLSSSYLCAWIAD